MAHFSGSKFGKSHTTCIDAAESLVKAMENLPWISKIHLGEIKQCGNGQKRCAFKRIDAGIEVTVRGPRTVQTIILITKHFKGTEEALSKFGG